ncbi:MAG: hypothetical protein KJ889_08040 [Gammaproteobacteria bacterium]|nr:hypothetical protein [Gammaproteobacteria bacterium]MBU4499837.1 hypothetical protein [Gammaproteobacteria bacterium]
MHDKYEKSLAKLHDEFVGLPQDVRLEFIERFQRHSFSARLDAYHAKRDLFGFGNACSQTWLLFLSGRDRTDRQGKTTLPLQSLLCGAASEGLANQLVMVREPVVVATAHGSTQSFLTVTTHAQPLQPGATTLLQDRANNRLSNDSFLTDVSVEVMSWRHDGTPAAETEFSWTCTVEGAIAVFIGG